MQPALLRHEIVSSPESLHTIASARFAAARINAGKDDRLIVVVGPCSIHSTAQAIEYAHLLKQKMPEWPNLLIVMRAYLYVHFYFLLPIRGVLILLTPCSEVIYCLPSVPMFLSGNRGTQNTPGFLPAGINCDRATGVPDRADPIARARRHTRDALLRDIGSAKYFRE